MLPVTDRTVRLAIPARPEFVCLARHTLEDLARLHGLPSETLADLKLALTEACANAVNHAYGGAAGTIDVVFELSADRIAFEVGDHGIGFVPDAGAAGEAGESGLGLSIVRALADELEIGFHDERGGSRLRFVKLLPA